LNDRKPHIFRDNKIKCMSLRRLPLLGLPARCTPHGLRKRCLTDLAESGRTIHEIMSVSGHLTMKEVERYTRMADRARNARAAMAGRV
jgi:integrase